MSEKWIYNGVEFNVGDRVKVVDIAENFEENGMGFGVYWNNVWAHSYMDVDQNLHMGMDGYIGMEFTIEDISEEGVFFEGYQDGVSYGFPLSCMINLSKKYSLPTIQQKEAV